MGDGTEELWLGGGRDQEDALFKYENGKFLDIANQVGLHGKNPEAQSYGPTCYDMNNDGTQDMMITRDDGVHMYINNNGIFTEMKLNLAFDEKSTPVGVTCGDINNDGLPDLFVSTYLPKRKMEGQTIFLKEDYGGNSLLFANRGDWNFEDITDASGLRYTHNTFSGIFIDVDDDGLLDLVVAHDTGEARTYKNLGGEKFIKMPNPITGNYGYPMGIAVGDYNNDGRPDFFFSNTGSTLPTAILKGDLDLEKHTFMEDWLLFKNDGDFKFTNVASEAQIAKYEFAWGAIFEDFNLDGLQDLVVAENYVDLPTFKLVKLPCRFLLNTGDEKFIATGQKSGVVNKNFAISPLSADFNNDGYPDLVYSNIAGTSRVFINNGGSNNYLKIKLQQTPKAMGARVQVVKTDGSKLTDWLISAEGLGSDQSHVLVFGLGKDKKVAQVNVKYADGSEKIVSSPAINQTLFIVEDQIEEEIEDVNKNR